MSAYDRWVCTTRGRSRSTRAAQRPQRGTRPWSGPNGASTTAPPARRSSSASGPGGHRTTTPPAGNARLGPRRATWRATPAEVADRDRPQGRRWPGHRQNHCSSRSRAIQKPSPSLTWPCQISGMKPAPGAERRRAAGRAAPSRPRRRRPARPRRRHRWRRRGGGGRRAARAGRSPRRTDAGPEVGGQLGVGDVEAEPTVVLLGPGGGVGGVDEEVAEELAAHVPGERRQRLRAQADAAVVDAVEPGGDPGVHRAAAGRRVTWAPVGEAAQAGDDDRVGGVGGGSSGRIDRVRSMTRCSSAIERSQWASSSLARLSRKSPANRSGLWQA